MFNKKTILNIVKYTGAATIGVTIDASAWPAVTKLFGLDKVKKDESMIPSEDIEESEICEEE